MLFRPGLIKCSSPSCENTFFQKYESYKFCCRLCGQREWSKKKRNKDKKITRPLFRCRSCGDYFQLDFDPLKDIGGRKLEIARCNDCKKQPTLKIFVVESIIITSNNAVSIRLK